MVEGNRGVDGTRPLPRANGEQLAQNVGRKVRLVVKVRTPPPPPTPQPRAPDCFCLPLRIGGGEGPPGGARLKVEGGGGGGDPGPSARFSIRTARLTCPPSPPHTLPQVEGFSGNRVRGTAADGASVFVEVPADGGNFGSAFVEFEGEVIGNDCLREEAHTDFGDAFDFANYNELCKLSGGPAQGLFLP